MQHLVIIYITPTQILYYLSKAIFNGKTQIFSYFSAKKMHVLWIHCFSARRFNEYPKHMFSWRSKKILGGNSLLSEVVILCRKKYARFVYNEKRCQHCTMQAPPLHLHQASAIALSKIKCVLHVILCCFTVLQGFKKNSGTVFKL